MEQLNNDAYCVSRVPYIWQVEIDSSKMDEIFYIKDWFMQLDNDSSSLNNTSMKNVLGKKDD